MDINEFNLIYKDISQKHKILMTCLCGDTRWLNREKAQQNIKKHKCYICRKDSISQEFTNIRLH